MPDVCNVDSYFFHWITHDIAFGVLLNPHNIYRRAFLRIIGKILKYLIDKKNLKISKV